MIWELDVITWEAVAAIIEFFIIIFLLKESVENKVRNKKVDEIIQLQFFSRFVERYQKIMVLLPSDVYSKEFDISTVKDKEMFLRNMRSYFDLCSQEYFLYQKGKISKEVWCEWEEGILSSFNYPAFQIAWNQLSSSEAMYADFKVFISANIDFH